ncbi:MAG: ABC transporter ATP-binding protein [Clostridia bacterium]|nr:ABC transporter ATP-binding protein [Clostridia bacterium]
MKKLLKYMKEYWLRCLLAPFFKLLEATSELFVPLVMADIIDKGIKYGDCGYILGKCGILVLLAVLGLSFTVLAQYFSAVSAVGFVTNVKKALMRHILSFEYSEIDRTGTASLLARMTGDLSEVQNGVNLTLRLFMRSPFIVIGAAVMAFTVDRPGAMVFAVVIPILFAVVFAILLSCVPIFKKIQAKSEKLLFSVREHLYGVRVIRSFGIDGREKKKFDEDNGALTKFSRFAGKISALLNPLTYVIINLGIVALLYSGAIRVEEGKLTVGQTVALYNYMSQILIELLKLANLVISISRSLSAASRVGEVFEIGSSAKQGGAPVGDSDEALRLEGVSFAYSDGASPVLSDISFSLRKGETLGIIGPTGSGKTTLINLISGFYEPTQGNIKVYGGDASSLDQPSLRRAVRRVPQHSVLFRGTVRDNLLWAQDADDDELKDAARTAQALGFIEEKGGLDAPVGEDGAGLSGGQKQRLAIARALVGRPGFIIFDDSFSALDPATDKELRRSIGALEQDPTVIISSQRTSSVMSADKILVLEDGRCVGYGAHAELLSSCPVYREIYATQFGEESIPPLNGKEGAE